MILEVLKSIAAGLLIFVLLELCVAIAKIVVVAVRAAPRTTVAVALIIIMWAIGALVGQGKVSHKEI